MSDENKLIMITDYKEMTREELEEFADKMRVERNSLTLKVDRLREDLAATEEIVKEGIKKKALGPDEDGELGEPLGGPVLG